MNLKIKFSLIVILLHFTCNSQLLKDSDVIFNNFKAYSQVGNTLTGKIIKSGEAITKVSVSSIGINTYIAFQTTLVGGGEQVFIVSNVSKEKKLNKLTCDIECRNGQDPERKTVKFIFEYTDEKLTKIYFPLTKGIIEYY